MNLFVARLHTSTTTKDLQKLFEHYGGVVSVKIILDRFTGKSKCYGFIEMPDNDEANEALKELNNAVFQGNVILVKDAAHQNFPDSKEDSLSVNRGVRLFKDRNADKSGNRTALPYKSNRVYDAGRNFGYRGSGFGSYR
jgi:RNA recognition motif-containing protein